MENITVISQILTHKITKYVVHLINDTEAKTSRLCYM